MSKMISILMIIVMFTGCSSSPKLEETKPEEYSEPTVESTSQNPPETPTTPEEESPRIGGSYKVEYPKMSFDIRKIEVDGDDIYHSTFNIDDNTMRYEIFKNEESIYVDNFTLTFTVKDSEVWVCNYIFENQIHKEYVGKLGVSEDDSASFDITPYLNDGSVSSMCIDKDDRFYLQSKNSIVILNPDGSHVTTIEVDNPAGLVTGGDGNVYILTEDRTTVMSIDSQNGKAEKYMKFPDYRIFNGGLGYQFILENRDGIYGVTESQEIVPIALWEECGIPMGIVNSIHSYTDDSYLLQDTRYAYILRPATLEEMEPKIKVSMATTTAPKTIVDEFNKHSDKYMIQMLDYSNGNTMSLSSTVQALNNDLEKGNYPDLFDFTNIPEAYYIEKGLVADLYPFMDADSDINRDDFILLDNLSRNGKLYFASSFYHVDTKLGPYSTFGDNYGWSLDEYLEIQNQHDGEIFSYMGLDPFFYQLTRIYAPGAIDWESGTCDFNNADFIKILEVMKQYKEKKPSNTAKSLVKSVVISTVWGIAQQETLDGEKLSLVGWPTLQGTGCNLLILYSPIGICNKGNTQDSWEVMKYILTENFSEEDPYGIPVLKADFNRRLEKEMTPRELDENAPFSMYENNIVVMTQEDADKFLEFLDSSVYPGNTPDEVINLIIHEGYAYFRDEKTAEGAVYSVQKKVTDFLSKYK